MFHEPQKTKTLFFLALFGVLLTVVAYGYLLWSIGHARSALHEEFRTHTMRTREAEEMLALARTVRENKDGLRNCSDIFRVRVSFCGIKCYRDNH